MAQADRMKLLAFLFDMAGRARRRDFWLFMAGLSGAYLYLWTSLREAASRDDRAALGALLHNEVAFIALTLVQIATLAMWVRRLHDRNKSGAWLVLALVPVVGQAWMVWELGFRPGVPGANRFGPPPRSQTTFL
jgi:uncharacterized membrane protein YhaH (DUF805 family)